MDSLAVAIGSVHAMKAQAAELDIERLDAIRKQIPNIPLVLHGASGVKTESFLEAIPHGICKINVATYLNQGFIAGMREGLEKFADSTDPRKSLSISRENVKERVREKMRLFGSSGVIDSGGGFRSPPKQLRSAELGAAE